MQRPKAMQLARIQALFNEEHNTALTTYLDQPPSPAQNSPLRRLEGKVSFRHRLV